VLSGPAFAGRRHRQRAKPNKFLQAWAFDDAYRTMNDTDVLRHFRESGALLEGHFRLSSGLHSSGYLQCALVLQHPARAEALGAAVADATRAWGANVVLSPALGGIVIGQEVGRALGVRAIFAERTDGTLALRRGHRAVRGQRREPGLVTGRPCWHSGQTPSA
jgi:hypothetical protein